ncbi:MAG: SdrD B-like domain-containing protein, partial [Bacteroidota bacterium]
IDFCSNNAQAEFNPWSPVYDATTFSAVTMATEGGSIPERVYPQPWITDIEFTEDGKMIIGIRDRFADQHGYNQVPPNAAALNDPNTTFTADGAGDVLMASLNQNDNQTFVLESNSSNGTNGAPFGPTRGAGQGEGPSGGEFFFDDRYRPANAPADNQLAQGCQLDVNDMDPNLDPGREQGHDETSLGGIFVHNGKLNLLTTVYDPLNDWNLPFNNAGIISLSTVNGERNGGNQIYATPTDPGTFAKGNGLGDVEGVGGAAPIEIGNRVWLDGNGNGRQDPEEDGINGVTVRLFKDNGGGNFSEVAVATTAANPVQGNGFFLFSSDDDPDVQAGMNYEIRVSLTDVQAIDNTVNAFTAANAGGDSSNDRKTDLDDSDASSGGVIGFTTGAAGENNFTLDVGVTAAVPCNIAGTIDSEVCSDNGTSGNDTDDEYTITVTATITNGVSTTYEVVDASDNVVATGTSGSATSFVTAADGGTETYTFRVQGDVSCVSSPVTTGTLTECSDVLPTPCVGNPGDIGGVVFVDDENDGAKAGNNGQPGVVVRTYDCAGMEVAGSPTVTDANGDWTITGLTVEDTFRVEFTLPTDGSLDFLQPGVAGTDNGTNVQFVSPTDSDCNVDYGVVDPATACAPAVVESHSLGSLSAAGTLLSSGIAIVTCGVIDDPSISVPQQYTLGLIDVRNLTLANDRPLTDPIDFHHPDWTVTQIGNVFGTTTDNKGNFYATASSHYGAGFGYALGGDVSNIRNALIRYGEIGGGEDDLGAAGTVYKMDSVTGQPTVFAQLPQQSVNFTHVACEDGVTFNRTSGPGLGNIEYDVIHDQFFVSNFEDGRIYRLAPDGTTIDVFDPQTLAGFAADDGTAGLANDFKPYGMAVSPAGDRLYFGIHPVDNSLATSLEEANVYYVELAADGSITGTEQFVVTTVPDPTVNFDPSRGFNAFGADPGWVAVSDLHFNPDGNLVIGQRTGCGDGTNPNFASSHNHGATYLIYDVANNNLFNVETRYPGDDGNSGGTGNDDVYGGIGIWDTHDGNYTYVVSSSDIREEVGPHGILIFPDDFTQTGNGTTDFILQPSATIPYFVNFATNDFKGVGGDAEVYSPCGPVAIQLGNYVWIDADEDGVQDPCELPITGLPVTLFTKADDGTLTQVDATTTDATTGEYYFNDVLPDTSYVIAFGDLTGEVISFAGTDYELTAALGGEGANPTLNDSDGVLFTVDGNMVPAICYNTADTTDHTLDVGLVPVDVVVCAEKSLDWDVEDWPAGEQMATFPIGLTEVTLDFQAATGFATYPTQEDIFDEEGNVAQTITIDVPLPDDTDAFNNGGGIGGNGESIQLAMGSNNTTLSVAMEFASSVDGLMFSILDFDTNENVEITAMKGMDNVMPVLEAQSGTPSFTISGNEATGTGGNIMNTPDATLNVMFTDSVDAVTLTFTNTSQVALSDLKICEPKVMSLGNLVWVDSDNDGLRDNAGEPGLENVELKLYKVENMDGEPDDVDPVTSTTTDANGNYLFDDLQRGKFLVWVDSANFALGAVLDSFSTSLFTEIDADENADNVDNGLNTFRKQADSKGIFSGTVCLTPNDEPLLEVDQGVAGSGNAPDENSNLTVDFGVIKDSDYDGAGNEKEGMDDRDNDGIPNAFDFDPAGYIYCVETGEIVTGGTVEVISTPPGGAVMFERDGSSGNYQFFINNVPGVYEIMYTPPAGYTVTTDPDYQASTGNGAGGSFDPTPGSPDNLDMDDPVVLGTGAIDGSTTGNLPDASAAANPYYLTFDLDPSPDNPDPFIFNNNIPLDCPPPVEECVCEPTAYSACWDETMFEEPPSSDRGDYPFTSTITDYAGSGVDMTVTIKQPQRGDAES